jgi:hypothetical protein
MITNSTYYDKGSLYIPNSKGAVGAYNATTEGIDTFIDKCEEKLLTDALNYSLFQTIKTQFNSGVLIDDPLDWVDRLINGYSYTIENVDKRFKGLKDESSCIPFYVFNRHLNDNYGSYGMDGMQRNNNSAATPIDPTPKDVETWNQFVTAYQGSYCMDNDLPIVRHYRNGTMLDYYKQGNEVSGTVDLLTFLDDYEKLNPGTFENLNKRTYERKNSFGL